MLGDRYESTYLPYLTSYTTEFLEVRKRKLGRRYRERNVLLYQSLVFFLFFFLFKKNTYDYLSLIARGGYKGVR